MIELSSLQVKTRELMSTRKKRRRLIGLAVAASSGIIGCSDRPPGEEDNGPRGTQLRPMFDRLLTVIPRPLLDFTGTGDLPLYGVRGLVVLGNGHLAIGNGSSDEVVIIDSTGATVAVAGGSGEGPGEIRGMLHVFGCDGNAFGVVDRLNRLSLFDGTGQFLRVSRIHSEQNAGPAEVQGLSSDCSRWLVTEPLREAWPGAGQPYRVPLLLSWHDSTGRQLVDTVPGPEMLVASVGGRQTLVARPWGAAPDWAVSRENLYMADGHEFEIRHYQDRELINILQWDAPRRDISSHERRGYSTQRVEWLARNPVEIEGLFPELTEAAVPDARPAVAGLLADPEGNLWVREYPPSAAGRAWQYTPEPNSEEESWWVVDPEGIVTGPVRMPAGLHVMAVGRERVYGVQRDAQDVEHVVGYPLVQLR